MGWRVYQLSKGALFGPEERRRRVGDADVIRAAIDADLDGGEILAPARIDDLEALNGVVQVHVTAPVVEAIHRRLRLVTIRNVRGTAEPERRRSLFRWR